jgi:hypothetical protein
MALSHSPSIVTDGLVLYLDAANRKSYPGTGTGWNNITTNTNNGTLINSPVYGNKGNGNFAFDGVDDYIEVPANIDFNFGTGDLAIEAWITWDGTYASGGRSLCSTGGSGSLDQIGIFNGFGIYFGGISNNVPSNYPPINVWSHVVATRIGTTIKIYINGSETASGTQSNSIGSSVLNFRIGWRRDSDVVNAHPWKGDIGCIKIYKGKGLTPTEIQQNFNALRGRFGI